MISARPHQPFFVALALTLVAPLLFSSGNDAQFGIVEAREHGGKAEAPIAPIRAGKVVYERECAGCHQSGLKGAPLLGHVPDWVARTPEWTAVLNEHASDGFLGMPAKGANPNLPEMEVKAAVDFMIGQIMPPSILAPGAAEGRLVYQTICKDCHNTGVNGAPIIGDRAAWAARSPNWHTVLQAHANEGFLRMPARGDQLQLFSDDIEAAIDFMLAWIRR